MPPCRADTCGCSAHRWSRRRCPGPVGVQGQLPPGGSQAPGAHSLGGYWPVNPHVRGDSGPTRGAGVLSSPPAQNPSRETGGPKRPWYLLLDQHGQRQDHVGGRQTATGPQGRRGASRQRGRGAQGVWRAMGPAAGVWPRPRASRRRPPTPTLPGGAAASRGGGQTLRAGWGPLPRGGGARVPQPPVPVESGTAGAGLSPQLRGWYCCSPPPPYRW